MINYLKDMIKDMIKMSNVTIGIPGLGVTVPIGKPGFDVVRLWRPKVFAYLREPEKGLGLYIENAGYEVAWNGKIICKSSKGSAEYGFTRMYPFSRYEYPEKDKDCLKDLLKLSRSDKKITVEITYQDVYGEEYTETQEIGCKFIIS